MILSPKDHPGLWECLSPYSVFPICVLSSHLFASPKGNTKVGELSCLPRRHMNSALKQGWKLMGRSSVEFRLNR